MPDLHTPAPDPAADAVYEPEVPGYEPEPYEYTIEVYDPGDYCGNCGIAWWKHAEDCRMRDLL